jgi:hypothetical protein
MDTFPVGDAGTLDFPILCSFGDIPGLGGCSGTMFEPRQHPYSCTSTSYTPTLVRYLYRERGTSPLSEEALINNMGACLFVS